MAEVPDLKVEIVNQNEPAMEYFAWAHLPAHLAEVSQLFGDLAHELRRTLPPCGQRAVALQRLLEAKDAAVRARLSKPA